MATPDERLLRLLQGIVLDIFRTVGETDWSKERQERVAKERIVELLKRFDVAVDEIIPEVIAQEYFGGVDAASNLLADEAIDVSTETALGTGGKIAEEFRKPVYLDSFKQVLEDTFLDLKAATRTAEMSAITTIEKTVSNVKDEISKGLIQGNNRKTIQAAVAKAFREDGMTAFITSDGKSLPLDFYAMTVTRTKMREAGVQGSAARYEDNGQDLVKVEGNGDSCAVCARYRGMIYSLRGETGGYPVAGEGDARLPTYHPNCRCTLSPYVISRKSEQEIEEGKKRNAEFDPNDDRRTKAQKAQYEKEQKARKKAREELKQFMRFNAALGADNFKSLGSFRKAKRENSPKFQELQSAYRSAMAKQV